MHTQFTHSNSYFIDRCALHLFFINDGCKRSGDDSKCANLLEKRSKPAKKKEPTKKKQLEKSQEQLKCPNVQFCALWGKEERFGIIKMPGVYKRVHRMYTPARSVQYINVHTWMSLISCPLHFRICWFLRLVMNGSSVAKLCSDRHHKLSTFA